MIEEDYQKYLSYDNGKGLLLKKNDVFVLEQYGIEYQNCSSLGDLVSCIGNYIDDCSLEEVEALEEVLDHLMEMHYYQETNK